MAAIMRVLNKSWQNRATLSAHLVDGSIDQAAHGLGAGAHRRIPAAQLFIQYMISPPVQAQLLLTQIMELLQEQLISITVILT